MLAIPVAPQDTLDGLRAEVDEIVCLSTPSPFHAVGLHYDDFHQVDDDEVLAALAAASTAPAAVAVPAPVARAWPA